MDEKQIEKSDKTECKLKNINDNSGRARANWQKVRNIFKQIRNNKNTVNKFQKLQKTSNLHNKSIHKSTIIIKQETLVKEQQKTEFMIYNFTQMSNTLKNGKIAKTRNIISVDKLNNPLEKNINILKNKKLDQKTSKFNQLPINAQKQFRSVELITYRPLPQLNYFINQELKKGNIDTTGAWVWEAQEILAYFLIKNYHNYLLNFQQIRILQIGAGCSGLAAMALTKILFSSMQSQECSVQKSKINAEGMIDSTLQSIQTVITDGKHENIEFLQINIKQNFKGQECNKIKISACQYLWGTKKISNQRQTQKFTIICGADILFFEMYHMQLITTLYQLLDQQGFALLVNPRRGKSLDNFLSKVNSFFKHSSNSNDNLIVNLITFEDQKYEQFINQKKLNPNFDPNTDDYVFIEIRKFKMQQQQKNKQKQIDINLINTNLCSTEQISKLNNFK